jgi:hypothetical protein
MGAKQKGWRGGRSRLRLRWSNLAVVLGAVCICLAASVVGYATVAGHREASRNDTAAPATSGTNAVLPIIPCAALAQHPHAAATSGPQIPDFGEIAGAPTDIWSATLVPASSTTGAYCDVKGNIAPQNQFELKLPTQTWQGRYMQIGCGAACGDIAPPTSPPCTAQPGGDFAVAATNDGHVSQAGSDLWAQDEQLRRDYAYRAVHVLSVASKAIIQTYYGRGPSYSYFMGCSDGGREALSEAERYPDDFNGIVAGSPGLLMPDLIGEDVPWEVDSNLDQNGNPILTEDKLPALHSAVMAACAGQSGTADGIIQDPRSCNFDPASLTCPSGQDNSTCLTPAQVAVVKKLYQGPVDEHGNHLSPGGLPYGSELAWAGAVISPQGQPSELDSLAGSQFRYMDFPVGEAGPQTTLDWQFTDRGFRELVNTYYTTNTDLTAFRNHGGKLIMYQATADVFVPPWAAEDYYGALSEQMGGLKSVQQFARLFMIASGYHCGGGYGPWQVSGAPSGVGNAVGLTNYIVDWVEQGTAPDEVVTSQVDSSGNVTRTWPVFPYPELTKYKGSGDVDSADSYVGAMPKTPPKPFEWIGESLFSPQGPR